MEESRSIAPLRNRGVLRKIRRRIPRSFAARIGQLIFMAQRTLIVDYGFGNLASLRRACEHLGAHPDISSHPRDVESAARVIVPGVGAFPDGIAELRARGLEPALKAVHERSRPLLGICLGMQFFFERSFEFGEHTGLGFFSGDVRRLIPQMNGCKVPHMGWNAVNAAGQTWSGTILDGVVSGASMYFVHSYTGFARMPGDVLATTEYCGSAFPSVVARGHTVGVQFHPEKSCEAGMQLLKNFLS